MYVTSKPPSSTRKRVLHLLTLSVIGGSQDNTFCTCELHDRTVYEVHLGCNPDGQWSNRARAACDQFHAIPALTTPIRPFADVRAFFQILSVIRRTRPDIVHTHNAKAGLLGRFAARLARVPFIVHTYHAFPFHDFMSPLKRWIYVTLERLARPCSDHIITLSENDRREGAEKGILDPAHSTAIYTGIDFKKLDEAAPRPKTRERMGWPDDLKVILFTGRFEPQKAPELMVEAFAAVHRQFPKSRLVMAGDGELRPLVEETIRRHGLDCHVQLLGFTKEVPNLLAAVDCFAFSSRWEAMGRSMVEALLMGLPVVVPAIYGIPEIVKHEQTGYLYPAGDVGKLSEGLLRVLNSPESARQWGRQGRDLTRQIFPVERMVRKIEEVYQK